MNHFLKNRLAKHVDEKRILKLTCIVLAFSVLSSCSSNRINRLRHKSYKEWSEYQWDEIKSSPDKDENEWTIYSRKVKGTNFSEFKIEGDIEAAPKACVAAFRQDILNQSTDLNNKKFPTYEIASDSNDSLLTYVIHHEPFPLKDTEMSVMYLFFNHDNGSTGVTWREAWDESQIQPSKKFNRVETFRGSWSFAPTSGNSCRATNSVQFDPKGVPVWLIRPMVINFLKNGLQDIRKETTN